MRHAALLFAALTALQSATLAHGETRLPFATAGNLIFMEVRLNGSRPLSFVLDTGAASMVVDAKISRELQLQEAEADKIGGAGAGKIEVRRIHGVDLEIGGLKSNDYEFVAADLSGVASLVGKPIEGIVGYEFLSRFIVTIDYAKEEIVLRAPEAVEFQAGEELPIRIEKGWAFVRGRLRVAGFDEITDEFLLDSGSEDAVDHPLAAKAADRAETQTGNGLGSPVKGSSRRRLPFILVITNC